MNYKLHLTVVYDACVLYPAPLRDVLMRLALTDVYHARWSNQIHEEWIRNLLLVRPDLTKCATSLALLGRGRIAQRSQNA